MTVAVLEAMINCLSLQSADDGCEPTEVHINMYNVTAFGSMIVLSCAEAAIEPQRDSFLSAGVIYSQSYTPYLR